MHKDDKTMLHSLMKRGMLQSPLLDDRELNIVSNQSLDPNVVNAESVAEESMIQGDEDPTSPLQKKPKVKCPPGMSKARCRQQKRAMKGTCNAHDKKCKKPKRQKIQKPKNKKSNKKSKSSNKDESVTPIPSVDFNRGGGPGGSGRSGGNGGSGTPKASGGTGKGIPADGLNINTEKKKNLFDQGWA